MSEEFIREINQDLRHQKMVGLWQKYGAYLIAFLVGTVVFVAGNVTLRNYNESQYNKAAHQYNLVEKDIAANRMDEALKNLEALADTDVKGYQVLVAFKEADIQLEKGQTEAAIKALDKLAEAGDVDKVYRDLAALKSAMIAMDSVSYEALKTRLAPLMIEGNPWKYMAKELLGLAAVTAGDKDQARALFTELEQDLEAPQAVKERAKNFKSVIE